MLRPAAIESAVFCFSTRSFLEVFSARKNALFRGNRVLFFARGDNIQPGHKSLYLLSYQ